MKIVKPRSYIFCPVCGYEGESFSSIKLNEKEHGESWEYASFVFFKVNDEKVMIDLCPNCYTVQRAYKEKTDADDIGEISLNE